MPRAPRRIRLKVMSSQWGSLAPDGTLALDLSLVLADPTRTPGEQRATIERVRTELTTGWQTAGNSRDRLTVADEREHDQQDRTH